MFSIPHWSPTVALSKALGYGIMIYTSFLFVLTTRDVEIAGVFRQFKVSIRKAFFRNTDVQKLEHIIAGLSGY